MGCDNIERIHNNLMSVALLHSPEYTIVCPFDNGVTIVQHQTPYNSILRKSHIVKPHEMETMWMLGRGNTSEVFDECNLPVASNPLNFPLLLLSLHEIPMFLDYRHQTDSAPSRSKLIKFTNRKWIV